MPRQRWRTRTTSPERSRVWWIGMLAGVLLAASCTGGAGTSAPSEGSAPGFPVSVQQEYGTAQLSAPPRRVVALMPTDLDIVIALGITPVAAFRDQFGQDGVPPWLAGRLDREKTKLVDLNNLSIEQLAALRPDVILGGGPSLQPYRERLSQIAPLVGYEQGYNVDSWQQRVTTLGKVLGVPDRARQLLAETEKAVETAKSRFSALAGKTYTYTFAYTVDRMATIGDERNHTTQFLRQFGIAPAPAVAKLEVGSAGSAVSQEMLGLLDADLVLVGYPGADSRKALEAHPLFQQLNAVRRGTYLGIDINVTSALQHPTVANIPWLIERLSPAFEKAAAG
ncbi:ABC transporter substrate-binding protein [Streptoalloteichus hindustanus]|uniref:Iron complex transport system substrate-binding protein n=1 Tax=Streptoalloteichus hindustanus TaxID=2017 RepID=A0A1M5AB53_STRHI|nr:ABC transporter substrate-binding protein [Streptoalloteichus hindustanus]SHF27394.1 iron complex transport system substrate-binding protein [Streptoalloteichus hindustanus]